MNSEKHEAMLKSLDLEKLAALVPENVRSAVQAHGLHKVAAKLLGLPEVTDATATMYIGRKLASRRSEQRTVNTGLAALEKLSYPLALLAPDMVGGAIGYSRGKAQKERGEEHTFGLPQAGSLLIPGGLGYQIGRGFGHSSDTAKKDSKPADKKEHKKEHKKDEKDSKE